MLNQQDATSMSLTTSAANRELRNALVLSIQVTFFEEKLVRLGWTATTNVVRSNAGTDSKLRLSLIHI